MDSRELGRLLALISHELRAPLGVVRGYLRMINPSGSPPAAQEQLIAAALKGAERAVELLTQLSTLAQLHRAETTFDFKPVRLQNVLETVTSQIALPTDPSVRLHVGEVAAVDVVADAGLLQTALTSLLAALIRAQARDATIDIAAASEERDGESGVTIHMATNNASDARAAVPLDENRGGLGLALPIAASIIDAHCGHARELRQANVLCGVVVWLPLETPGSRAGNNR